MWKNIFKIFLLTLIFGIFVSKNIFAGGIAGDGKYHYLAEPGNGFGNELFFVNKNVTVFENGGVLKEEWQFIDSHWKLKTSYWMPNQDINGLPYNTTTSGEILPIVIGNPDDTTNFYSMQSSITFEIIQKKFEDAGYPIKIIYIPDNPNSTLPLLRADIYDAGKDTTKAACVLIPGYTMGILGSDNENNGWNNGGAMTSSDSSVVKATKGFNGPIAVISYNTHEDYNGEDTNDTTGEYQFGILWDSGAIGNGAIDKAMILLDKMGIQLDGSRIVSHSTGHYLAMKIMSKKKVAEYWALSPNTRGSTMICSLNILRQKYDGWEDMLRHNYRDNKPENKCISKIAETLKPINSDTKVNILLSHGDAMTGGQGEIYDVLGNVGVLSYSDFQQTSDLYERDRRRRFLKYEALDNLKKFELKNLGEYKITVWDARKSISQFYRFG
jgi:hypothetical protein